MEAIVRVNGMDVTDLVLLRAMVPRAPHMRPTKNAPITAPAKVPAENPAVGVDPPATGNKSFAQSGRQSGKRGGKEGREVKENAQAMRKEWRGQGIRGRT